MVEVLIYDTDVSFCIVIVSFSFRFNGFFLSSRLYQVSCEGER